VVDDEEFPGLKTGAADKAERLNDKAAARVLRLRLRLHIQLIPSRQLPALFVTVFLVPRPRLLFTFSSSLTLASCLFRAPRLAGDVLGAESPPRPKREKRTRGLLLLGGGSRDTLLPTSE